VLVLLGACGGADGDSTNGAVESPGATPAASATTAATTPDAQAQEIYSTRCLVCHGPEGRGDGPGASALNPGPRNYHDTAWQETVTDQEIERAIVYGGAAVGKSPSMVANPDLGSRPEVVAALRDIIRNFGRQD
jgi:mono/diheme cytochrome c family protein